MRKRVVINTTELKKPGAIEQILADGAAEFADVKPKEPTIIRPPAENQGQLEALLARTAPDYTSRETHTTYDITPPKGTTR